MKLPRLTSIRNTVCLSGALLGGTTLAPGQAADTSKVEQLEKENQELRKRLDALEAVAQKEGLLPTAKASMPVAAMSNVSLSGFVQTSYFFNSTQPADREGNGYLWTTRHNAFSLTKLKVTLTSPPAER